jgi:hypothetical protein
LKITERSHASDSIYKEHIETFSMIVKQIEIAALCDLENGAFTYLYVTKWIDR